MEKHLIEPSHGESSRTEVRLGSHGNPLNDFALGRGGTKGVLFLIPFSLNILTTSPWIDKIILQNKQIPPYLLHLHQ